jgi:glycogen operon protein
LSAFFDMIQQDPIISRAKLIAEPWDLGSGGYQLGGFPPLWVEWNGKYRDTVRDFWRGEVATLPDFATRLMGSSDLYSYTKRKPSASVNFITAHDGFTLNDLVSYNEKHNEANGEDNRDGENYNRSWNCGVEGQTDDPEILGLRAQQRRNFLTTLLLSQGVPMLGHGDELGRTQLGNNNAYCQDSEVAWVDWDLDEPQQELLDFAGKLVSVRAAHPVLRRRSYFGPTTSPDALGTGQLKEAEWFDINGIQMHPELWNVEIALVFEVFLNGDAIPEVHADGNRVVDDSLLMLFNGSADPLNFSMPEARYGKEWRLILDTANPTREAVTVPADEQFAVAPRSLVVFERPSLLA